MKRDLTHEGGKKDDEKIRIKKRKCAVGTEGKKMDRDRE